MNVGQSFGIGVAGHHNVRFFGQQGLKGIKELFLRAVLVGQKLHIVDQQQIERVITFLELVKSLALIGLDHIRYKLLGMNVKNFGGRVVSQQFVADGVHQMGLSQTDTAVNEQRVVKLTKTACHMQGGCPAHAVGGAFYQRIKGQRRIDPVFEGGVRHILYHASANGLLGSKPLKVPDQCFWLSSHFPRSKR